MTDVWSRCWAGVSQNNEHWHNQAPTLILLQPPSAVCGVMCLSLGWVLFDLFNFSLHSALQGLWVVVFDQLHTPLERKSLLPWESGWSLVWWIYIYYSLLIWMNLCSQNVEGYSSCPGCVLMCLVPMARSGAKWGVSVRPSQCVQCPANAVTRVFNLPIFFPIAACSTDFSIH